MRRSILIVMILFSLIFAKSDYQFISPKPGSDNNTRESTIIIRKGDFIDAASLDRNDISVTGNLSGNIDGELILSSDNKTLIFKPFQKFQAGEEVDVKINGSIVTQEGEELARKAFSFNISDVQPSINSLQQFRNKPQSTSTDSVLDMLPDINSIVYDSTALGEGKIFLSCYRELGLNFQGDPAYHSLIMILENDGTPFFVKDIGSSKGTGLTDFKMHSNGLISYPKVLKNYLWTGGGEVIHLVMDNSFTVVDSFQMGNGYVAETHDFRMLPNGHTLLMGYYLTPIDLSEKVEGGHAMAYVDGAVVQELDADKNVVFQWRSWDYINLDLVPWQMVPNNTQQILNIFHLNAITMDQDGNLLLGTPGMGMKVSRQTGQVMWIIGGFLNQFTFENIDPQEGVGDLGGHIFHRLNNGNILVYDNSPFPWQEGADVISAEAVEYRLDEDSLTAELVWKYTPDSLISGWHAGSAQRLPNGNTVIGWGGPPVEAKSLVYSEVNTEGNRVMDLYFEGDNVESYRAFRFKVDDGTPSKESTVAEVSPGGTYDFVDGDSANTGINIKVNSYTGGGYNEITIKKYNFAPQNPEFFGKAPRVLAKRIIASGYNISSIDAQVRFDIDKWQIKDPDNAVVYHREFEGSGLFLSLETDYNHVTREVRGNTMKFGEFIIAYPDFESQAYPPFPSMPADSALVNQEVPVVLTWNPMGYVNTYHLQVARDLDFQDIVVDEANLSEAMFTMPVDSVTTYYWRVKAQNDVGESEWSEVAMFTSTAPYITITSPEPGDQWQRGIEHYIIWESNIADSVEIVLLSETTYSAYTVDTVAGSGAYNWEIPFDFPIDGYEMKLFARNHTDVYGKTDGYFDIIDETAVDENNSIPQQFTLKQNYPNPFNPETTIEYALPEAGNVNLRIFDIHGRRIVNLVKTNESMGNYRLIWNATDFSSGIYFYQLLVNDKLIDTKKMILLK